jgi:hypothetical protein
LRQKKNGVLLFEKNSGFACEKTTSSPPRSWLVGYPAGRSANGAASRCGGHGRDLAKYRLRYGVRNYRIKIGKILDSLHLVDFDLSHSSQNLLI